MSVKATLIVYAIVYFATMIILVSPKCGQEDNQPGGDAALCEFGCVDRECEISCEQPEVYIACGECEYIIVNGAATFVCEECDVQG